MTRYIRKEDTGGFLAWELPNMDGRVRSEDVVEQPQMMTVEELETIQRQAHEEGFTEGRAEGFKTGHQEGVVAAQNIIQEKANQFQQLLMSLDQPFLQLDDQVEQELVTLVINVAEGVIRHELQTKPEQVLAIVREAVAILPGGARNIRLSLHPEDAILVREGFDLIDDKKNWKVDDNAALTRGGCEIHTEVSHIDETVEKRFQAVVDNLLGGQSTDDSTAT